MKLARQLSGSSQVTSSVTTRSRRSLTKAKEIPAPTRNLRNVTSRKKTENSTQNSNKDIDRGVVEVLNWNDGELSKEVNINSKSSNIKPSTKSKIVVSADAFNNFEEVVIKKEVNHEDANSDKSCDDKDDKTIQKGIVGGIPHDIKTLVPGQNSCAANAVAKTSPQGKRVFIIKSVSGKSVTIIPRTVPIVLPKENCANTVNSVVNVSLKGDQNCEIVGKPASVVSLVDNKLKPNLCSTVTKSVANNTQCMATQTGVKLQIAGKQKVMKVCKVVMPKITTKTASVLKDTSTTTVNVSGNKRFSIEDINDIPMYVDNQTQTEHKVFTESSVQTEIYIPSPARSVDELPNITDLVEYLLETPKYCNGLDDVKKSDLLGMSKNIIMKGNTTPQAIKIMPVPKSKTNDHLKTQLFLDLKNCLHLDFLGNMAIHNAILEGNITHLKRQCFALRLRQVSINIENNQGLTPLQLAIVNGCDSLIMTVLCENGADVTVKDSEGNTTFHLAVMHSTDYNLSLIIKHSAQFKNIIINGKNDDGLTPLMLAAIESKADMVDILLQNGADPNLRDEKSGRTALFHAVEVNSNFVINLLLKYRADPRIRNFFGLTVLDAAKDLDMQDVTLLENNDIPPHVTVNINKRSHTVTQSNGHQPKKSKLSFIPSYQRVELSTIQKSVRRKYNGTSALK